MKVNQRLINLFGFVILCMLITLQAQGLKINSKGYFEKHGLNVIVLDDVYPEGHQGGVTIIQHGRRVAANGDLTLNSSPGQWQPFPKLLKKEVLEKENRIVCTLKYPDSTRQATPDQPIIYPDFEFFYNLSVIAEGDQFRIIVDLEKPLPKEWVGKVGFNLELYPADLFGKSYYMDKKSGVFPVYANTPVEANSDGEYEAVPMAVGNELFVAPDDKYYTMSIKNNRGDLFLIDGRVQHNNGWYIVRALVPAGATKNAIELVVKPNVVDDWKYGPIIQTSQVGFHTNQTKTAIIELDPSVLPLKEAKINKIIPTGGSKTVLTVPTQVQPDFLRYKYLKVDFTEIKEAGMYYVQYGDNKSNHFQIDNEIFAKGVWQPILEYFLPNQMCHMKVFEKYRVWHDYCHLDDALMAPENINHFDVYTHGKVPEGYTPLKHVPGLNKGGWHDAGDYDLRIESQFQTILTLARAYEEFNLTHDQTLINQEERIVEIHHPDGKPDALQQIEHGLLSVLGGYKEFGQFYRGILVGTLRQYAMMGEASNMTDNKVYEGKLPQKYEEFWYDHVSNKYDKYFSPQNNRLTPKEHIHDMDDRFVFLEDNPQMQADGIGTLAAAARVLKGYNDILAKECLQISEELYVKYSKHENPWVKYRLIEGLVELILTTNSDKYKKELVKMQPHIVKSIEQVGWIVCRVSKNIGDKKFTDTINEEMKKVKADVEKLCSENPYGIPYHPQIWGAGWGIQHFGVKQYYLYTRYPEIFSIEPMLNAMNFILGSHPGENTNSFVSNVGVNSQIIAYGTNRVEWSFIPGGVVSGTNLIRPDLPEMKNWPFMWQQTEYVIGGGANDFMFLALAANKLFNQK